MLYLRCAPGPPLDAFVDSIWFCRSDARPWALERVLPTGAGQLIVNLKQDETRVYRPEQDHACVTTSSGTVLTGTQSRYCLIDSAELECVAGVAFNPGGTLPFFRAPADELRDAAVPLDLLWGRRAAELRERLLEAPDAATILGVLERTLLEMFRVTGRHSLVAFALDAFARPPHDASIGAVADLAGLSAKRFIERFRAEVGIAPKHYCRIRRFQRALSCAESGQRVDWTRVAMDSGYFDQAHFIRDFRSFAGITPTMYRAARTEFRNHVKFVQFDPTAS